jgi:hypothetical protein
VRLDADRNRYLGDKEMARVLDNGGASPEKVLDDDEIYGTAREDEEVETWFADQVDEDPLNAARGVMFGVGVGALIWLVLWLVMR